MLRERTNEPALDGLDLPATAKPAPEARHHACEVCGHPLRGRRPEARHCGPTCRMRASRQRRRDDLIARVRRAEDALREAADALAHLKELAALGATLELGKGAS
jgi:hypothetical protein